MGITALVLQDLMAHSVTTILTTALQMGATMGHVLMVLTHLHADVIQASLVSHAIQTLMNVMVSI